MPERAGAEGEAALMREIGSGLRAMAEEHAVSLEHLEPLGVRLGLSRDAIFLAVTQNQQRLRILTLAHQHFERLTAGGDKALTDAGAGSPIVGSVDGDQAQDRRREDAVVGVP